MLICVNVYCLLFRHRMIGMQTQDENEKEDEAEKNFKTFILA